MRPLSATVATFAAALLATSVQAQRPRLAPPLLPAQAAPTPDESAARIEALQQRLLAAQQRLVSLERQLADEKAKSALLDQCRVKNGKLVAIGRDLIEAYGSRYHHEVRHDPMQLGRRRFEYELQALRESLFDQRVEVPVKPPIFPSQEREKAEAAAPPRGAVAPAGKGGQ